MRLEPNPARTIRVCKLTLVLTHPGITDDMYGYPDNNYLHFPLKRLVSGP
jgi:hypothetical protein